MRKLERGKAPVCLSGYKYGRDSWADTTKKCRDEIRNQLAEMQGPFCAYCESYLDKNKHIEHFFRRGKADSPEKTFEWENLFSSCGHADSCGAYKDSKAKDVDLSKVCKPDSMNPANYLRFLSDGKIVPQAGLESDDAEIAKNTIKVFNLNRSSRLISKRRDAACIEQEEVEFYYQTAAEFEGDSEVAGLLQDMRTEALERINKTEHSAVLLQVWGF